jgi:hypothetical protein
VFRTLRIGLKLAPEEQFFFIAKILPRKSDFGDFQLPKVRQ